MKYRCRNNLLAKSSASSVGECVINAPNSLQECLFPFFFFQLRFLLSFNNHESHLSVMIWHHSLAVVCLLTVSQHYSSFIQLWKKCVMSVSVSVSLPARSQKLFSSASLITVTCQNDCDTVYDDTCPNVSTCILLQNRSALFKGLIKHEHDLKVVS